MSKEFSVRLFKSGDEKQIIELLKISFPEWTTRKAPLDYWTWKYLDAPFGYEMVVAESDKKIIGSVGSILISFKIGSNYLLSAYGDDGTTHPDFRGMGVYSKINVLREKLRKEKGIRLACGRSVVPSVIKDYEKKGRLKFPHLLCNMLKVNDVNLHVKKKKVENIVAWKTGFNTLNMLNKVKNISSNRLKSRDNYKINEVKSFGDDANVFWNEVRDGYNFIIEKNKKYLNWRYCDPRTAKFTVKQAADGGKILGFIVSEQREQDLDYPEGYVTDLLTLPGRVDVADDLIKDTCNEFDRLGVNALHYTVVQGNPYQAIASRYGFVDISFFSSDYYSWQYVGAEEEFELIKSSKPSQVHFHLGDYL